MINIVSRVNEHSSQSFDHGKRITHKNSIPLSDSHIVSHRNRSEELKQVAKDMESLFAYQLLKIMRETSQAISEEQKGYGNDTYSRLFDIEMSKLMAERGMGLQDAIIHWLERQLPEE